MLKEKKGFAILQAAFLLVMGTLLWRNDSFPWWHFSALILLSATIYVWRRDDLWIDLLPFAILLLTYDSLRAFVGGLAMSDINVNNLIAWERWLTGGMPAAVLRPTLAARGWAPVLDGLGNLAYFTHFVVPAGLSIWLHRRRKPLYWPILTGFLGLSYTGFLSYVLFPAAPPWWATQQGFLRGAEAVYLNGFVLSPAAMLNTPNPLAAVPSMHCAYPLYWSLVVTWLTPRRCGLLWVLTGLVLFSVVYLGHHYVVDVVAGLIYGGIGFLVAWLVARRTSNLPRRPRSRRLTGG